LFPKQEFYIPLKNNALLNDEQLQTAFLNLDELIDMNEFFLGKLRSTTGIDRRSSADQQVSLNADYQINESSLTMVNEDVRQTSHAKTSAQ